MEQVILEATRRTPRGKGAAHQARRRGLVPGVAYGHGLDPLPLLVDERTLTSVLRQHHGSNVLLDLRVDGQAPTGLAAIIKALQTDPVTDHPLSVDFQWVSLQEKVTVSVALRLEGTAAGAQQGGIVEQMLHEVHVTCLPLDIPAELWLPITGLQIGDTLHVSDLVVPDTVRVLNHPEDPVVTVRAPVIVAEVAAEEAAEAAAGEEAAEGEAAEENE